MLHSEDIFFLRSLDPVHSAFDVNYGTAEILSLWNLFLLGSRNELMQRATRSRDSIINCVLLSGVDISHFIPNVVHNHNSNHCWTRRKGDDRADISDAAVNVNCGNTRFVTKCISLSFYL